MYVAMIEAIDYDPSTDYLNMQVTFRARDKQHATERIVNLMMKVGMPVHKYAFEIREVKGY